MFGKWKIIKGKVGFELMTYRFIANAQTDCAVLLGNNFGNEQLYKLYFIVLFI